MKKNILIFLIFALATTIGYAQSYPGTTEYVWTNSGGAAIGESVVATLNFSLPGPYAGAVIVGQIIDGNSNWGQVLPTVANFKVNANLTSSYYSMVQNVVTPNVTLELKSLSATQVILVANCANPYKKISILFRFPVGNLSTITVGDASINSSGTMLISQPTYTNQLTGRLAINVTNNSKATDYVLAVGGKAIAEAVTVQLQGTWPDYVFKKDYTLPSLTDVKTYIDQNQHLPEIPSAQQMEKDGINLGEMNKLLLKKVEELALYLIESNKKQAEQEERMKKMEQHLELLTKRERQ